MTDQEKDLQAEELADLARRLEAALEVDAPDARREKALFVAGAGAHRRTTPWLGAFGPAAAAVALLVVLAVVSRTALPGDTLFPVRKVLGNVGLAPSTAHEVREHLDRAERLIVDASTVVSTDPRAAQDLAFRAEGALREAGDLADELDGDRRDELRDEIDELEDRAKGVYETAEEALEEREQEPVEPDDSSGPGSGDDDDSSGSGSGSDDSSGSGSGSDDSSGPGGGADDSSGPGGGADDSSGSGSGSGGEDSSGSGSGGDSSGTGSGSDDGGGDDSSGSGSGHD